MPSVRAQRAQAVREDRLKLKLERTFRREIRAVFASIAKDFRINLASTGTPLSMTILDSYRADWKSLLNRHYMRVQNAFKGMVRKEQEIKQEDNEVSEDDVLAILLVWRQMQSEQSAAKIMDTNEKNMRESLLAAQRQLSEEGQPLDSRSVAALAVVLLRRKFKRRVGIISEYETQQAAEKTKITEAQGLSGQLPGVRPRIVRAATKTWRTMRDSRVRPSPLYRSPPWVSHRKAEGQRQRVNDPFTVSGQKLMYPGDWSLGATYPNLAGCRCVAIYAVA